MTLAINIDCVGKEYYPTGMYGGNEFLFCVKYELNWYIISLKPCLKRFIPKPNISNHERSTVTFAPIPCSK